MNAQRAEAYGNVTRILANATPSKLHAGELMTLRQAADAMVFADTPPSEDDIATLRAALGLLEDLVECDRWTMEGAERLATYIEACAGAPVAAAA